jgi:uncharacterized OsmC-like protein
MAVQLSNGRLDWTADEPTALGGTDTGPNPYELLLTSLAACTCITLSYYCQHKGIALESVSATYDFSRVHADDCKDCDDPNKGFIDKIISHVQIEGDFDDAQRKRLAEIVERAVQYTRRWLTVWRYPIMRRFPDWAVTLMKRFIPSSMSGARICRIRPFSPRCIFTRPSPN